MKPRWKLPEIPENEGQIDLPCLPAAAHPQTQPTTFDRCLAKNGFSLGARTIRVHLQLADRLRATGFNSSAATHRLAETSRARGKDRSSTCVGGAVLGADWQPAAKSTAALRVNRDVRSWRGVFMAGSVSVCCLFNTMATDNMELSGQGRILQAIFNHRAAAHTRATLCRWTGPAGVPTRDEKSVSGAHISENQRESQAA